MHAYDIEVSDAAGNLSTIRVEARNRSQAARKAEKAGYTVRSVNMIG